MSYTPFNSYVSKIFENHPIAVWGLDDNIHYLSSIDEAGRNFANWTGVGCSTSIVDVTIPQAPSGAFTGTGRYVAITPVNGSNSATIALLGTATWEDVLGDTNVWQDIKDNYPDGWNEVMRDAYSIPVMIDLVKKSMCVSLFAYSTLTTVEKYTITIKFKDRLTNKYETRSVEVPFMFPFIWEKLLATFNIENILGGFTIAVEVKLVDGETFNGTDKMYFGAVNVGQWSETFCHNYDGILEAELDKALDGKYATDYDADIDYDADLYYDGNDVRAAPLLSYTSDQSNGYVLVENKRLLAVHDGIPLVYGSINTTCLSYPITNPEIPSIIVPAYGFMTESGKYNEATLEFWARLENIDTEPFRIVGPVDSVNGLYVEEGFLTLKIGEQTGSYYVGRWYRPMLLSIRLSSTRASLLINGEEAITLILSAADIEHDGLEWIGFYCQKKTYPFEIDCIAIYPYYQDKEVAKKNFVFGQGVQKTNIIDQSFLGDTVQFDFPYSKYTVDYRYPVTGRWKNAFYSNLVVTERDITIPQYTLPELHVEDPDTWYTDMATLNSGATAASAVHFTLSDGFLYYKSIDQINGETRQLYVSADTGDGPLLTFKNEQTGHYVSMVLDAGVLTFNYYNGTSTIALYSHTVTAGRVDLGIDIDKFSAYYARKLHGFFSDHSSISMYVGGFGGTVFDGKLYGVGFNNSFYTETYIETLVNGFYINRPTREFISNYQLLPHIEFDKFIFDIGISGYWKSAVPLSFFAKYVKSNTGEKYYDLDILQLNADVVTPSMRPKSPVPDNTYGDILARTTELNVSLSWLNHSGINYVDTYEDLKYKEIDFGIEDAADFSIKPYVTFQTIDTGIKNIEDFPNIEAVGISRVLDITKYDWDSTKFYFVDGTVIYPPKTFSFKNMMMAFHIKFDLRKSLKRLVALNSLEACSLAFDNESFYNIGTKFGTQVYPVSRSGVAMLAKPYNPFVITKESSGYLYLTGDSGIQLMPETTVYERGLYVPINKTKAPNFELGALRFWMRYGYDYFPSVPIKIFEIHSQDTRYIGYLVPDSDKDRARIFVLDANTRQEVDSIKYVQEDMEVFRPYMTSQRWCSVAFVFGSRIDLSREEGYLLLMPGVTFQNIGIFESSNEAIQNLSLRSIWRNYSSGDWQDVLNPGTGDRPWEEIYKQIHESIFFVDAELIYKSLIGTESVIANDNVPYALSESNVKFYQDIVFRNFVMRAGEPVSVN